MEKVRSLRGKEAEEKKSQERRRKCLILIHGFLQENNLTPVLKTLEAMEPILHTLKLCENIDLAKVIDEFESYHELRFDRLPIFYKKIENPNIINSQPKNVIKSKGRIVLNTYTNLTKNIKSLGEDELIIRGLEKESLKEISNRRQFPSLYDFPKCTPEWLEIAQMITQEIVQKPLQISWDDIIGNSATKELLLESLIYPSRFPSLFSSPILEPCRGMLLYGPPGTGKTMLAKAVAAQCDYTFFNVSSALIISKWRGESEKILKVLFEVAQYYSPSIIYFDEVDAVASRRGHDHESSRRLKSELLVHLDGILSTSKNVFFLAATNLPWDIDESILRRFEKKILIDLPNKNDREVMLKIFLPFKITEEPLLETKLNEFNYNDLADQLEGYSGSDIWMVCKETVRKKMRPLYKYTFTENCSNFILPPIKMVDVEKAIGKVKPTMGDSRNYLQWHSQHGSC